MTLGTQSMAGALASSDLPAHAGSDARWLVGQWFDVVKQHYGIARIYAVKAKYRGPHRLLAATLGLGCASPVLYRVGQGMRFNEYAVFGQRMPFSGLGLPDIPVPRALIV